MIKKIIEIFRSMFIKKRIEPKPFQPQPIGLTIEEEQHAEHYNIPASKKKDLTPRQRKNHERLLKIHRHRNRVIRNRTILKQDVLRRAI
jgi:hypothetical protein